jgi:hypothetical protein
MYSYSKLGQLLIHHSFLYIISGLWESDLSKLYLICETCFAATRERCYKQIAAAVAKYREIKKNINEGLNFYVTLQVCLHFHLHLFQFY